MPWGLIFFKKKEHDSFIHKTIICESVRSRKFNSFGYLNYRCKSEKHIDENNLELKNPHFLIDEFPSILQSKLLEGRQIKLLVKTYSPFMNHINKFGSLKSNSKEQKNLRCHFWNIMMNIVSNERYLLTCGCYYSIYFFINSHWVMRFDFAQCWLC